MVACMDMAEFLNTKKRKLTSDLSEENSYPFNDTQGIFPSMVSQWTVKHLTDIGLAYAEKDKDPIEMINCVPGICQKMSNECHMKMEYLITNMDFEIHADKEGIDLNEDLEPRKEVAMRFLEMLKSNLTNLEQKASGRGYEYYNMYAAAQHFICKIKEFISREFYHQQRYKQFYTDMMMKFGEMFSLLSESGASMKKNMYMGCNKVSSAPDIRFKLMNTSFDLRKPDWIEAVVSVVEVKQLKDKKMWTNPAETCSSTSTLSPDQHPIQSTEDRFDIRCLSDNILGRHGGELLAEYRSADTCPYIIGMIVLGSKVIVTCLKLSNTEYIEIEEGRFPGKETATINFSKPLDMFLQADRKILYEIFFRLSQTCCSSPSQS